MTCAQAWRRNVEHVIRNPRCPTTDAVHPDGELAPGAAFFFYNVKIDAVEAAQYLTQLTILRPFYV